MENNNICSKSNENNGPLASKVITSFRSWRHASAHLTSMLLTSAFLSTIYIYHTETIASCEPASKKNLITSHFSWFTVIQCARVTSGEALRQESHRRAVVVYVSTVHNTRNQNSEKLHFCFAKNSAIQNKQLGNKPRRTIRSVANIKTCCTGLWALSCSVCDAICCHAAANMERFWAEAEKLRAMGPVIVVGVGRKKVWSLCSAKELRYSGLDRHIESSLLHPNVGV